MALRLSKKRTSLPIDQCQAYSQMEIHSARHIERMIQPKIHLWLQRPCHCVVCTEQKPVLNHQNQHIREYKELSKKSHEWLKQILLGLTQKVTKTLKLFLPDIMFVVGDGLEIFSTNKKDYRIIKFGGTTPVKSIYHTLTRLKKQYKGMLEENFRKTMIDKINPKFMHVKYFDRLLPSHFHDGDDSKTLSANKSKFKSYILNNNEKYIISSIEQHKMNDKEPFATIRYVQGNFQLLNQKEFEMFSLVKIPEDVVYVQSFIKSKEAEAIVMSMYSENSKTEETDQYLWKKAELYVMVLLGGLSKYDEGYDQLENFQDEADELMKLNPSMYSKLMTYQIVHFLSMAANIYIRHIKIRWIINDIDNLYIQEIIEFQTEEVSKRPIRYKMPSSSEIHNFYHDGDFFVQIHKEMKKKKEENLIKVKKQLEEKKYQQIFGGKSRMNIESNLTETGLQNPEQTQNLNSRVHIFRRLTPKKKRTFSHLEADSFILEQKMSVQTKEQTSLYKSNKFSTINARRSLSRQNSKNQRERRISVNPERRSISAFGDIITRYEHKIIENDRRKLNKSVNRYEKKHEKSNHQKILDFQVRKSKKALSATIDFSLNY